MNKFAIPAIILIATKKFITMREQLFARYF
jgi:hypothetical protein